MSMTEYVLDASFIVDHLRGNERVTKFRHIISQSSCFISAITWAEVVSKFERAEGLGKKADDEMVHLGELQPIGRFSAQSAALLHAQMRLKRPKFSLGDAFAKGLAVRAA